MTRQLLSITLTSLTLASSAFAFQSPEQGMFRYPDVSQEQIAFVHANDLWLVARDGGVAIPLASPEGAERAPKFSADGSTIAFVGNYEGGADLYTMPVTGGIPFRVTHHPDYEMFSDWTQDGRLLFAISGLSGIRGTPKLFAVAATGGLPTEMPLPYGVNGCLHADGKRLAYSPNARDNRNWKRYRGGTATDVWIFDIDAKTSTRVTDWEGTDSIPMWHGDTLYYMSDRGSAHRLNIWSYAPATSEHRQLTHFTDFDLKWPSIGPGDHGQGEIVFQNGNGLFLLDLESEVSRSVDIQVPGARDSLRARDVDASKFLVQADVSPTGKRAVVEARGDIWTLPAENGRPRNLTRTDGVAERDPSWSPDGRWVAYFSDEGGEYEIFLTQSDGRGETRRLTEGSEGYRYGPTWAPDSEAIAFSDRSGSIYVHNIESAETTFVARHEGAEWGVPLNWSHDARWLAWSHLGTSAGSSSIYLYDTEDNSVQQVTSDMFNDHSPTFDRMGDWLYFASARNFNGHTRSAIDSTYVYRDADVLLAVPLRADVENPWLPKSDEEEWKEEDSDADDSDAEEGAEEDSDAKATDDGADSEEEEESDQEAEDDGVSGSWKGQLSIPGMGELECTLDLQLSASGKLTGSVVILELGNASLNGEYDATAGTASGVIESEDGQSHSFEGTLAAGSLNWEVETTEGTARLTAERVGGGTGDSDTDADSDKKADKPRERVEILLEGFERRALQLPISAGSFGNLRVNDKHQLLYARRGSKGGIKLYDLHDDDAMEVDVCSGGGFSISADGKIILLLRGRVPAIGTAKAGSSPKNVKTAGMNAHIDPRNEWPQLFTDTWRLFRDYFYAANLHGVDWDAVYKQYRPMIDACATRNDVDYVMRELIGELNCGHTYISGGPLERGPTAGVGMLGCDFTLEQGAYRIARIVQSGTWDSDSRGPLTQPGVDVNEGDWLLAVDGIPLDTSKDPWAAFVGLASTAVELTVSANPTLDDDARRVRVKTQSSEGSLRYREWIENNRAHTLEASGGRVGYIYVPDTGTRGRNNFFRQFYGQAHLDALIIDERWNGGGSFPSREIEALNRPRTNYWARRWGRSWPTPHDSHQGPKCMLINRNSGSGGDMFPYLFKQAGLGKLIGTRTWGGLVGYSGSPALIDGASLAIPSFGFYELDGSWGVEGHGVDPDIEVMDDPALMQDGRDPQLDAAIEQMLLELKTKAYSPPQRPTMPDRSGMGIPEADRNQFPDGKH